MGNQPSGVKASHKTEPRPIDSEYAPSRSVRVPRTDREEVEPVESFTPGSRTSNDNTFTDFTHTQYNLTTIGHQPPMTGFTDTATHPKVMFDPLSFDAQENGIPTVFEWEGGATPPDTVYVVGSYNNWQLAIPLARSHSDFSTILYLPKGKHEYKFIVNGEWSYALDKPTAMDGSGNVNNVIEVRETDSVLAGHPVEGDRPASPPGLYLNVVPREHYAPQTYEKLPPMLPPHLRAPILIKGPDPEDPISLPIPHHVMLNHLTVMSTKDELQVLGATMRLYNKYITTVVYKPYARKRSASRSKYMS